MKKNLIILLSSFLLSSCYSNNYCYDQKRPFDSIQTTNKSLRGAPLTPFDDFQRNNERMSISKQIMTF